VRIFIASSDRMLRLGLLLLLESEPGITVIGVSDRAEGLATVLGVSKTEVLLLDYEIAKQMLTVDLIADIHRLEKSPKIIVFSIDSQVEGVAITAGAHAFISKTLPPDNLLPILRDLLVSEKSL